MCSSDLQMTGPATSWHWIGRDGRWVVWSLAAPAHAAVQEATLAPAQFSAILDDAMADEVLFKFMMQGEHSGLRHAALHALVAKALPVAQAQGLPDGSCVAWCSHWVAQAVGLPDGQMGEAELQRAWQDWLQENAA